ncbi:hypothetical protein NKH18_23995 [Streptomyces sp. M10(2022)]
MVLTASPKGELHELSGPRALLPHGAGFNKSINNDGSPDVPSGLDPTTCWWTASPGPTSTPWPTKSK